MPVGLLVGMVQATPTTPLLLLSPQNEAFGACDITSGEGGMQKGGEGGIAHFGVWETVECSRRPAHCTNSSSEGGWVWLWGSQV